MSAGFHKPPISANSGGTFDLASKVTYQAARRHLDRQSESSGISSQQWSAAANPSLKQPSGAYRPTCDTSLIDSTTEPLIRLAPRTRWRDGAPYSNGQWWASHDHRPPPRRDVPSSDGPFSYMALDRPRRGSRFRAAELWLT